MAVDRAGLFCKVAWVYCTAIIFCEKIFCFKRLSNFKTPAVFFILELDKTGILLHITQNTEKSRFYQNSTIVLVNFSGNSEQS